MSNSYTYSYTSSSSAEDKSDGVEHVSSVGRRGAAPRQPKTIRIVSKQKLTHYTNELIKFLKHPHDPPTDIAKLSVWQQFFSNVITWCRLFGNDVVTDAGIISLARNIVKCIRAISMRYYILFMEPLQTENRVLSCETLWHALSCATVVGYEALWIEKKFHKITPFDDRFEYLGVQRDVAPFMRMTLTELWLCISGISKVWCMIDYSATLEIYVDMLEMRATMLTARLYKLHVLDRPAFREIVISRERETLAEMTERLERERKQREEEELRKRKMASIGRESNTAKRADIVGNASGSGTDASQLDVEAVKAKDGNVTYRVIDRTKIPRERLERSEDIQKAAWAMREASESRDNEKLARARLMWQAVRSKEYHAYRKNKRAHENDDTSVDAVATVNHDFKWEMYSMFTEMRSDIVAIKRFNRQIAYSTDEMRIIFNDTFPELIEFSTLVIEKARVQFISRLGDKMFEIEGEQSERMTREYFEANLRAGEKWRHVRRDPNRYQAGFAAVESNRPGVRDMDFNAISVRAQEKMSVMFQNKLTPRRIRELIMLYTFDAYYNSITGAKFYDMFVMEARDVSLDNPPPYPIIVLVFNRYHVFDQNMLYSFNDIYDSLQYWVMRIVFDPDHMGVVGGVDITPLVGSILDPLVPFIQTFVDNVNKMQEAVEKVVVAREMRAIRDREEAKKKQEDSNPTPNSHHTNMGHAPMDIECTN